MKKYVIYLITAIIVVATAGCAPEFDKDKFKYEATPLPVTGVKLNKNELTLPWNERQTLSATISPSRAAIKEISWTSSNPTVATIDPLGEVVAVGVGKANITVTTTDGKKTDVCEVTVNPFVELDVTSLSLLVGDTYTFTAAVRPQTYNQTITWSTSNDKKVSVTPNGEITALEDGSSTIKATIEGDFSLSCEVQVGNVPAESVEVDKDVVLLAVGESTTIIATVFPDNAANQNVDWKIVNYEDKAIVSTVVEGNEITVTRLSSGDFDVVAVAQDGYFKGLCSFPKLETYEIFIGSGSKVWTWGKLEWGPLDRGGEWWSGDFEDILGPYGSKDGTGATMTFSKNGVKLLKTKTDGSTEEGTFKVDMAKKKYFANEKTKLWSIGQLYTNDVTILWGVHLDHGLIDDDTKLPVDDNYPNGEEDVDKVYAYDIISLSEEEIVLAVPGDSPDNKTPDMNTWSGAWYWYFTEKK